MWRYHSKLISPWSVQQRERLASTMQDKKRHIRRDKYNEPGEAGLEGQTLTAVASARRSVPVLNEADEAIPFPAHSASLPRCRYRLVQAEWCRKAARHRSVDSQADPHK